jgi:hypothetical protein
MDEYADIIEVSIESLVENWVLRITTDENIPSNDGLNEIALRDHAAGIIEEICANLRADNEPSVHNTREGRVSAYTRFRQDYSVEDLIAEFSHLRLTITDHLDEHLLTPDSDLLISEYVTTTRTIHLYIDEALRYGASIFVDEA